MTTVASSAASATMKNNFTILNTPTHTEPFYGHYTGQPVSAGTPS